MPGIILLTVIMLKVIRFFSSCFHSHSFVGLPLARCMLGSVIGSCNLSDDLVTMSLALTGSSRQTQSPERDVTKLCLSANTPIPLLFVLMFSAYQAASFFIAVLCNGMYSSPLTQR